MLNKLYDFTSKGAETKAYKNDPRHLEGDWKFTGYFPKGCKPLPGCHTNHLQLSLLERQDDTGYVFQTKARLAGEECSLQDIGFKGHGISQAKEARIYHGEKSLKCPFGFDFYSKPYYIDTDEKREKLFILEKKGDRGCWSTFQKTSEIEDFEEYKSHLLSRPMAQGLPQPEYNTPSLTKATPEAAFSKAERITRHIFYPTCALYTPALEYWPQKMLSVGRGGVLQDSA